MCELFGLSAARPIEANDYLRTFYAHSDVHKDGWGLAVFYGGVASIEKEPIMALKSNYLKERLRHRLAAPTIMAHIRLASVGSLAYENCHPFARRDNFGRRWTLEHNGTIFCGEATDRFRRKQEGGTDSERILLYLVESVNTEQKRLDRPLSAAERFAVVDKLVCGLAKGNKLNLIIYDGELMYVHTNLADSLYCRQLAPDAVVFSTRPLDSTEWRSLPFTTLLAYRQGQLAYTGTCHGHEYIPNSAGAK